MKKLLLIVVTAMFSTTIFGQQGKQHDPNPKKDKDVQAGYDQHQKEHNDKKNEDNNKKYEVDKSGGGHGGVPTSGGFTPSDVQQKKEEPKKEQPKK